MLAVLLVLVAVPGGVGCARADGVVNGRGLFGGGASLFSYAGPSGQGNLPAVSSPGKGAAPPAKASAPERPASLTALLGSPARSAAQSAVSAKSWNRQGRPARACLAAIVRVSRESGLPSGLLTAIGRVESGRRDKVSGRTVPWPWTVNAAGKGHFYATERAAVAAVRGMRAQGIAPIDVGCMQIDLDHHPHAFASLNDAFDPLTNVRYGAAFLKRLHKAAGAWPLAIADYHSQTPSIGAAYAVRVLTAWRREGSDSAATQLAALGTGGTSGPEARSVPRQKTAMADPSIPAADLRQDQAIHPVMRPPSPGIIGRTGRSLADYRRMPVMIAGR